MAIGSTRLAVASIAALVALGSSGAVIAQEPEGPTIPTAAPELFVAAAVENADQSTAGAFTVVLTEGDRIRQKPLDVGADKVDVAKFSTLAPETDGGHEPFGTVTLSVQHGPEWEVQSHECHDYSTPDAPVPAPATWYPQAGEMRIDAARLVDFTLRPEQQEAFGLYSANNKDVRCKFEMALKPSHWSMVVNTKPATADGSVSVEFTGAGEPFSTVFEASTGETFQFGGEARAGIGTGTVIPDIGWKVTNVVCAEESPERLSYGEGNSGSAVYGIDPGETVACTFSLADRTIPEAGPWKVREVSRRAVCKGKPLEVTPNGTETLRLSVLDDGRRLQAGPVVMTRTSRGHYSGRNRATIKWVVRSPKHVTGTNTAKRGGCRIIRNFTMRYQGQ